MGDALRTIFSKTGLIIGAYFIAGIFLGPTAGHAGHLPSSNFSGNPGGAVGAWFQEIVWVLAWPLGLVFHHPTFSL